MKQKDRLSVNIFFFGLIIVIDEEINFNEREIRKITEYQFHHTVSPQTENNFK